MTNEIAKESIARSHWVLASRSPRRRRLLANAGFRFDVISASDKAEDDIRENETPTEFVARQARQKADNVAGLLQRGEIALTDGELRPIVVIGCDTIAVCNGEILGKPRDVDDARRILQLLSGNRHEALSGLCLIDAASGKMLVETERTILYMHPLTEETLARYLATNQWQDKAGAFGYQDGIDWLEIVEGSESNVVGLPLELLADMIGKLTPNKFDG